jgi:hypothetical protein
VKAFRVDKPPVIDGKLDEPFWQKADKITDFIQRQPHLGEKSTFPVTVRIAYDSKTVYIGFEIHSGDPKRLISTVLQRDGSVNAYDDHFGFRFDTFHNHRDLYYFYVNPRGTKLDGHASDEGVVSDNNWDGVWEVKTSLLSEGWAGEVAMPLSNFRFRETEDGIWGFACIVYNWATQENIMWPDMGKNSRKPSLFGHITGLTGLDKTRPLAIIPSLSQNLNFGRHEKIPTSPPSWKSLPDKEHADLGLDIRYRPASFLESNTAVNPDFATVEADQFLINLSLDELQLPEKRPFFTEGQDRFATPIQLLYTRRIGLGDQEMIGGEKLHGQAAGWSFGALDVLTGEKWRPDFNFSAVRLKRDILRSSTIGFTVVSKDSYGRGSGLFNRAAGLDLNLQINRAALLVANINRSQRQGTNDGFAGYMNFSYGEKLFNSRDNVSFSTAYEDITADFDIRDIGYIGSTRLNRRGFKSSLGYDYWVKSGGVSRFSVSSSGWYYQNHAGDIKVQDGRNAQFSIQSQNLIQPGVLLEKSYIFLPGGNIAYHNTQRNFSINFGPYPRFMGTLSYRTGDNNGYSIRYSSADLNLKPTNHMTAATTLAYLESTPLAGGGKNFSTIGNLMVMYLFTQDTTLRVFIQGDSSSKLYLANGLFRWEFRPGSVFYLSYRENRDDSLHDFTPTNRQVQAKISYYLHR